VNCCCGTVGWPKIKGVIGVVGMVGGLGKGQIWCFGQVPDRTLVDCMQHPKFNGIAVYIVE